MHDGSITFSTALDNAQLEKDLAGLTKKIEKQERKVADLGSKRDAAKEKSLFDVRELDAEKAKLQEIKDRLADIRAMSKDKSLGVGQRDEVKSLIPEVQEELKEQRARVGALQAEWNKTENAVARYSARLIDAEAALNRQKSEAGYIQQQIDEATRQAGNMNFAAKKLDRLKAELKGLEDQGKWFGDEDYDKVYGELIRVTDAVKSYRKEVAQSAAYMQEMADSAGIADQHIADLGQELALLRGRLSELKKAGIGLGHKEFDDISARIAEINRELKEYKAGLLANHGDSYFEDLAESAQVADQHIADLCQELGELKARQDALGRAGIGLGYQEYDDNAARISAITSELNQYQKTLAGTGSASEQTAKKTESAVKRLVAAMKEGNTAEVYELLGAAVNSVFQKISSGLGYVQKSASAAKQFGKAAVKAFTQAALAAVKLLEKVNVFPKMFSAMGGSLKKLGQMIRRVFVFSVITAGLRAVRSQMSAYLAINTEFSSALGQLKGVLLTAFQPIYDVAVPALTVLMNLLARAIAAITQFTAVLFGTTAKNAQKNAQALYKQAKATSAAGSAAAEASGQLASFDEINKLQDESSGGGGGAGTDTGPLFDWEYEDTPFPDWGEAFDAFLDKILGNIPKLKGALKGFADWLNSHSKKLYDMFAFPGVLDKVKQIGHDLADAFNDLVNWIDWSLLGKALGAGLNLALNFLTAFIYEFDWINLGRKLAEFINGLVSEINWYEFGRLMWSGFKIGLETLAGFLLGLDMQQLAQAASNIVMGFFNSMAETISSIEWGQIGAQIAAFLASIDWAGIFQSVYDAFGAALGALSNFIIGFLDEIGELLDMHGITDPLIELVQTVHDFIQTIVEDTIAWVTSLDLEPLAEAFQHLLEAISPLVSTISEGLLWAYENVLLPLATWVIEDAAPATVDALSKAIEFLNAVLGPVIDTIRLLWDAVIQPFIEWVESVAIMVIEDLGKIFEKLAETFNTRGEEIQTILSAVTSAVTLMWQGIQVTLERLQTFVDAVLTFIGDIISTKIGSYIDILSGLIDFITGVFTGDWEKAWNGVLGIFKGIWNGIVGMLEGAVNFIIKGINFLINQLNKVSFDVPDWVPAIGGKTFGFNIPPISEISIPRLAQGAVIPPNREFMAVLGDQTSGNNLEAPESLIRKIVREEAGGNNTAMLEAILEAIKAGHIIMVDRRVLGKTVTQEQNRMTRQSGRSVVLG